MTAEARPYPGLNSRLRTAAVLILLTVVLLGGSAYGGIYAWGLILFCYLFLVVTAGELVVACSRAGITLKSLTSRAAFLCALLFTPTVLLLLRLDELWFFHSHARHWMIPVIVAGSAVSLFAALLPLVFQSELALDVLERTLVERMISVLFVSVGGGSFIALASGENAAQLFFWLVLVVAVNDSSAYFVGAKLSSPPLSPVVSPRKTLLGSVAGLLCGTAAGALGWLLLPTGWLAGGTTSWWLFIGGTLFVVLLAQLGDLLKSLIKRAHGMKDMGSVLPGHGGILDRIDGMLVAAPLAIALFLILQSNA